MPAPRFQVHPDVALVAAETVAFGGETNMQIAHDLFATDNREIQQFAERDTLPIGFRELFVLLCTMMRSTGLEWYETGDVWNHVITVEHRSALTSLDSTILAERAQEIPRCSSPMPTPSSDNAARWTTRGAGQRPSNTQGGAFATPWTTGHWAADYVMCSAST
ncbi:hypothetical protein ABTY63_27170 [Streptomyces solisilvae]|uniref:hypothetical protein n=1 Tax=Streptomyces malaysiensis TaxID=92644 RepID=UPI0033291D0A